MEFTPQQKEHIRDAKQRGEQRIYTQLTPDQKKAYQEAVALEMAGKDANIARVQKLKAAAEQPGFLGDIRRAILVSRPSIPKLAAEISVDERLLSDFQIGDAELPAAALDRLLEKLGLRLMQEIPK
jgi:hypothetical protein